MEGFGLRQDAKQSIKANQRLMMSPEMQQALATLQMPLPELALMMRQEVALNPIFEEIEWEIDLSTHEPPTESDTPTGEMEISDNDFSMMTRLDDEFNELWAEGGNYLMQRTREEADRKLYQEASIVDHPHLIDTVVEQLGSHHEAAREILGNLDESGLLTTPLEEISALSQIPLEELESALYQIQRIDPPGLAAATLQESLLLQLEARGLKGGAAYQIVEGYYDDLLHNRLRPIERGLGLPIGEIEAAIRGQIALLDTHPGSGFTHDDSGYLTPDVTIVENEEGGLEALVNDDPLPKIRFNRSYLRMLGDPETTPELRRFIEEKLASGRWLLRTVHQRGSTLLRLADYLIKHQRDYISDPSGKLNPMTMKEVARALEVHESTIARIAADKNLYCPRGLIPLRRLFTNGYTTERGKNLSAETVRDQIGDIVRNEDRQKPLSDEAISSELAARGIECARRTVAKHRRTLGLGNAAQRRSYS